MGINFSTDLDYIVHSSHKTGSSSVRDTLRHNNYNTGFIHLLKFNSYLNTYKGVDLNIGLYKQLYNDYKNSLKKMKIITIIRNPIDRLKSSFFQTYHSDEVNYSGINEQNTTIMKNDIPTLYNMFINNVCTSSYEHYHEALDEILYIFQIGFNEFVNNNNYFKYDKNFLEIYVLDFNKLNKEYLSSVLNISINSMDNSNNSNNKIYSKKYSRFKKLNIPDHILNTLKLNSTIQFP
jgi:hypothetical protein